MACLLTLVTGAVHGLPLWAVIERTALATAGFGVAGFIGGLAYEKLWLK
ncbi:MAG: hypothetical protein GX444_03125 [Myxococcales bacterium]|nr:hypothetical protein [Myxococcales bacterium]